MKVLALSWPIPLRSVTPDLGIGEEVDAAVGGQQPNCVISFRKNSYVIRYKV